MYGLGNRHIMVKRVQRIEAEEEIVKLRLNKNHVPDVYNIELKFLSVLLNIFYIYNIDVFYNGNHSFLLNCHTDY